MKKSVLAALSLVAVLGLAGCASGGDPLAGDTSKPSSGSIVIGSADFPESQVVATLYSQALSAAGVKVTEKFNIGSREVTVPALQDGSIDLMPEYSGAFLSYLEPDTTAVTTDEVVDELTSKLPKGLSLLKAADAEDKDMLAVTKATADKYSLTSISDLAKVSNELSVGAAAEFETRQAGLVGLKSIYGITFKEFVPLDAGGPLTIAGLTNGQVQVANIFSTDPSIKSNGFVALDDDKGIFLAESLLPVINSDKASTKIVKVLDGVSAVLTTKDLIDLNARVAAGDDIPTIATEWLKDKGLI